jgi:hypothetical protein
MTKGIAEIAYRVCMNATSMLAAPSKRQERTMARARVTSRMLHRNEPSAAI